MFFFEENLFKFNISNFEWLSVIFHEVVAVLIFLAQQITTRIEDVSRNRGLEPSKVVMRKGCRVSNAGENAELLATSYDI